MSLEWNAVYYRCLQGNECKKLMLLEEFCILKKEES